MSEYEVLRCIDDQKEATSFLKYFIGTKKPDTVMRNIFLGNNKGYIENGEIVYSFPKNGQIPTYVRLELFYKKATDYIKDFLTDTQVIINFLDLFELEKELKINSLKKIELLTNGFSNALRFTQASGTTYQTEFPKKSTKSIVTQGRFQNEEDLSLIMSEDLSSDLTSKLFDLGSSESAKILCLSNKTLDIIYDIKDEDLEDIDKQIILMKKLIPGIERKKLKSGTFYSDVNISVYNTKNNDKLNLWKFIITSTNFKVEHKIITLDL